METELLLVFHIFHRQEIVLIDNEIAYNEAIIEEREQGIKEIQQQITEVNEIFKDLAVLVHEQGIIIGRCFTFSSIIRDLDIDIATL